MNQQKYTPVVLRSDIYNIRFYETSTFNGSLSGMNYRIEKTADANEDPQLKVTIWPGPMNYDHTDNALKVTADFPFSSEGLDEITEYLNTFHYEHFKEI